MQSLSFTAVELSPKFDLNITTGNLFSGNTTTLNVVKPAAKLGNLNISVGNVFSGNNTTINRK